VYPGLAALALSCTIPALAESPLEEIVITSSRVSMPLREVGTSISVINQQQIEQLGFNSLYDVLRTQPSVAVSNTGGAGKAATLRIRGEEGYRTLVLLDGIDISDTSGPQVSPRMEQLLSSGIERVEILRGPQGLMYGADAGGVVNIRTRTNSEGTGGTVSAEGGRYGTRQLAASFGAGNELGDFQVSATDYETDGFNARSTDTVLRDADGFDNTTLHGRARWHLSDQLNLEIVLRDVEGENAFDGCFTVDSFAPTDDCRDDYQQRAWRAGLAYNPGVLAHELDYSRSETEREFFSAGRSSFMTEGQRERISYLGSFAPGETLRLVYGADLERESIDDGTFDEARDQTGYYLEWQGGFLDALYLTAGARYDDNDDFGSHSSYRASAAYLLPTASGELKLKGSWGTGFRAPSLYEIAYNRGFFAFPPASETVLREEESEGHDLGLAWTSERGLYLEATYFDQSVSNEIFFDLVGFSGYLQGDGEASSSGLELVLAWPLSETLSFTGNYTYNDTDTSDGSARAFRPEQLGNIGLNWQAVDKRLTLGLNLRLARDAENTDGSALDDYEVVDVNASFTLLAGLEIYGRLENLLDEDYREVPTYNTAGRAAYAGLRYNF
jgi:vitamin B12 transporter